MEFPNSICWRVDELLKSIGPVTPPINSHVLRNLYNQRNYPAMLGWIKNSMHLDLQVGLRIVDRTETTAPMWIETPNPMPAYGTREFRISRVVVNATRDVLETKSFCCVVAGFAHELSHVILLSMGHKLQHDEKAVDLTAMVLGYQDFISDAEVTSRKGTWISVLAMIILLPFGILAWGGTSKRTWRLGYLTRAEAMEARRYLAWGQQNRMKWNLQRYVALTASVTFGATVGAVFGYLQYGHRLPISEWLSRSPGDTLFWAIAGAVVAGIVYARSVSK